MMTGSRQLDAVLPGGLGGLQPTKTQAMPEPQGVTYHVNLPKQTLLARVTKLTFFRLRATSDHRLAS